MWRDILDFQSNNIAAAELAVDRKIEHGEIAHSVLQLQLASNRSDVLRS
jgi:hypothetical protein